MDAGLEVLEIAALAEKQRLRLIACAAKNEALLVECNRARIACSVAESAKRPILVCDELALNCKARARAFVSEIIAGRQSQHAIRNVDD